MEQFQIVYKIPHDTLLEKMLFPISWPIKLFQQLNTVLINALWGELIHGKKEGSSNPVVLLFGLAFVFIGSLYCYKYENILKVVVLVFTVVVLIDKFIFKTFPSVFEKDVRVVIGNNGQGLLCWKSSEDSVDRYFSLEQIDKLFIRRHDYRQGFIMDESLTTWELVLSFKDKSIPPIELYEDRDMLNVHQMSQNLSERFGLPCISQDEFNSEQTSMYAPQPTTSGIPKLSRELKLYSDKKHIYIKPRFTLKKLFMILKKALKESGFVLFIVIFSSFIERVGYILAGFYGPTFGVDRPESKTFHIDSIFYFFRAFLPEFDPADIFELAVAGLLILIYIYGHISRKDLTIEKSVVHVRAGMKLVSLNLHRARPRTCYFIMMFF